MRMIPLNLLTLYADLAQRVSAVDVPAASITRRMVGGQRRIYATFPGGVRKQVYLGTAGDRKAEARAIAHIRAANDARANRKSIENEIEEARSRGRTWRKHTDAALKT